MQSDLELVIGTNKSTQEQAARVRACNYVNFKLGGIIEVLL